jgi:hypothetical protein
MSGAGAQFSEVIPGDEDRGGDGAIDLDDPGEDTDTDNQGGTGSDDGGPGSRNM